jgi:hypothetical protein
MKRGSISGLKQFGMLMAYTGTVRFEERSDGWEI